MKIGRVKTLDGGCASLKKNEKKMSYVDKAVSVPMYLSATGKRSLAEYQSRKGHKDRNRCAAIREILDQALEAGIDSALLGKELDGLTGKPTHKVAISKEKKILLLKIAEGVGKSRAKIHLVLWGVISQQMHAEGVGK